MKSVWKTPMGEIEQTVTIGRILHVGYDPKDSAPATVWHEDEPAQERTLVIVGTGTPAPEPTDRLTHVGTSITPQGFVFHVFEKVPF